MALCVAAGVAIAVLEFRAFDALHFRWNDNAYASVVWGLLGLHFFHTVVATGENGLMTLWLLFHGLDRKHARDIRVTGTYWYWVAGLWVVLYLILFCGVRLF